MAAPPPSQLAFELADNIDFNLRCQLIALQFAVNFVLSEDPATANHANRLAFATKIMNGSISPGLIARVVLTDANIQAAAIADFANNGNAVADSNIDGRLQAMWNTLANAGL